MTKFPNDLAAMVFEGWENLVAGEYVAPPCPPESMLENIFNVAYLSSSLPEEGRYPQFNVVVTRSNTTNETMPGAVMHRFDNPRSLDVSEFRRLAPATDMKKSAIWVEWEDDICRIVGLCDLGTSWHRSRMGMAYNYKVPSALIIQIDRPGRLRVYQGAYAIASLSDGDLVLSRFDLHGFLHPSVLSGLEKIEDKFTIPEFEHPRDFHSFWFNALWNVFASIANSISALGHGGMIIIANADSLGKEAALRIKYPCNSLDLQKSFIQFINCRNKTADLWTKIEEEGRPFESNLHLAELALIEATEQLVEATRFVSQLSGCDGAIMITDDLKLIGFGIEVKADISAGTPVSEVDFEYSDDRQPCDIEQFGMRHRSAIKLVSQAPSTCVLAISQDGPISGVFWSKNQVFVKKGIALANINMPLA